VLRSPRRTQDPVWQLAAGRQLRALDLGEVAAELADHVGALEVRAQARQMLRAATAWTRNVIADCLLASFSELLFAGCHLETVSLDGLGARSASTLHGAAPS